MKHPNPIYSVCVLFLGLLLASIFSIIHAPVVKAADCIAPAPSYGTDTVILNVPTSTTYHLWVRMNVASNSANTILLQVNNDCANVGGGSLPINAWTWVGYQNGNATEATQLSLPAGNTTVELLGNQANVGVDDILALANTTCIPVGDGGNCTADSQSTGNGSGSTTIPPGSSQALNAGGTTLQPNNTTVNLTRSVTVLPTPSSTGAAIKEVKYYLNHKLVYTATKAPFTYKLNPATLENGRYILTTITIYTTGHAVLASETFVVNHPFLSNVAIIMKDNLAVLLSIVVVLAVLIWLFIRYHFTPYRTAYFKIHGWLVHLYQRFHTKSETTIVRPTAKPTLFVTYIHKLYALFRTGGPVVISVLITVFIGVKLLLPSQAQTPFSSVAASSGSVTLPATIQTDVNAISGKYVQFSSSQNGYFNVVSYGADPSGQKDSDAAIKAAIAAAEVKGGNQTIYFPAGTYILNDNDGQQNDLQFTSTNGSVVNVLGAGQTITKVVEEVGNAQTVNGKPGPYPTLPRGKNIFAFDNTTNGFYFKGITVDGQTYNAGDSIRDGGNNSTIEDSTFLGAINGNGGSGSATNPSINDVWDVHIAAFCNQDPTNPNYVGNPGHHHSNNIVDNVTLVSVGGVGGNDDLDFSCQENGTISNITDTGWGTAMYIDSNITVSNYTYYPGSANRGVFAGWFVTDGHNIAITNFTSYGAGGKINSPNYPSSDITIDHEVMKTTGYNLFVGDASNVMLSNDNLQTLSLAPSGTGTGSGLANLTLINTTTTTLKCKPSNGALITNLVGATCP